MSTGKETVKKEVKQKKHIVRYVVLSFLLIILIALIVFGVMYGRKISILYRAMTTTPEAIESMQIENDRKTNELLDSLSVGTMRDLTDEERALLASGKLSKEEALALIRGETTIPLETPASPEISETVISDTTEPDVSETILPEEVTTEPEVTTTPEETTTAQTTKPKDPTKEEKLRNRIDEIIAEIYLLRATYLNKIDELIASTKAEYVALPKSQHNLNGKMKVIERMIPKGDALEAECDAKMEVLLTELIGILKELNMDTSIVDEIRATYREQKDLKQIELYNQYSHHLK